MGNQKIIIKKSTVAGKAPVTADLEVGELAVNTADAKLYTKHNDNSIKQLGIFSAEITTIKKLTAAEYAALGSKDNATMYVIVG